MLKKAVFWLVLFGLMNCNTLVAQEMSKNIPELFYEAATKDGINAVRQLIHDGYNIEQVNQKGYTALCLALKNKNQQAFDTLISAGASKNARCLSALSPKYPAPRNDGKMIHLGGGLAETTYGESLQSSDTSSWSAKNLYLLGGGALVLGGVTAAFVGGGGGGNSGSGSSATAEDILSDQDILGCIGGTWETRNGVHVCTCPSGYELKNGACIEKPAEGEQYQTTSITNATDREISSEADKLKVQLGANVTNTATITGESSGEKLVAMEAEGFSAAAFSGDLTPETQMNQYAASRASNLGTITLSQTSTGGELYGLSGLSGGITINQKNGQITLNAKSDASVYGLYAENEGYGSENNGKINLNLSQNALYAYGIYATERGAVNNGEIIATVTNPVFDETESGIVAGLFSAKAQNNGKILLRRGEKDYTLPQTTNLNIPQTFDASTSSDIRESNLNNYGMYIVNGGVGQNLKNGFISLDVTKSPFYNYGIYASQGTQEIINQGRIEIFGQLASYAEGVGGAYGIRFIESGTIINEGEIETRRCIAADGKCDANKEENWENLSVIGDAYLGLLKGKNGTINNKADINLFVNNAANEDNVWTLIGIDLEQNGNGSGIMHNADLKVQIGEGSLSNGSQAFGIYSGATVVNAGNITMSSKTNNLNLLGIAGNGEAQNNQYSAITITGSGYGSGLYGMVSSGWNAGTINITHEASGLIQGVVGENSETGKINLKANPKTDEAMAVKVAGSVTLGSVSNSGEINIEMHKSSFGIVYGMLTDEGTTTNSGTIDIALKNRIRNYAPIFGDNNSYVQTDSGDYLVGQNYFGKITGIELDTSSSIGTVNNTGNITIDAMVSANPKNNETIASDILLGHVKGITANGGNITNAMDSIIDIQVNGTGTIIGLSNTTRLYEQERIPQLFTITNNGTVKIKATNTEDMGGISAKNLSVYKTLNDGTVVSVTPTSQTTNLPFDIIGIITNSNAVNNGNILLDVSGNAKVAGMVAYDGGMAVNGPTGLIEFKGNADNFVALYGVGKRVIITENTSVSADTTTTTKTTTTQYSSVYNYGTIKINETLTITGNPADYVAGKDEALAANVNGKTQANQTVLTEQFENGALQDRSFNADDFEAGAVLEEKPAWVEENNGLPPTLPTTTQNVKTLTLNDGVIYYSEKGGSVEAEGRKIFGSVVGGISNIQYGNEKIYKASGSGNGAIIGNGDASDLEISSASYLFDASWEQNAQNANGLDIVMTMKSFDDVTSNKSLASFLEANYANGNNEAFFNDLKGAETAVSFNASLDSLTGRDTIAKFTHEDLTAMREVNFAMNELMFVNNDKPMFETNGSLNTFNFKNDNNSSARYALANKRISPRMKIGYAMSTTNLNTDNDDDTTRRNSVFQVFAPISYDRSGWQMIATPQIGFARGHYTRKGYNGTSYEGVIEKRIFALMNEARYPMTVGKFEIAPTVEFNAIAYNTKGSEDEKAYSLTMPSDNSLSVEAGLGIYAKHNVGNMKFNAGLMVYREFADPYNIKMGMNGMEGTFDLYDNRSEYRGVASFGFGYDVGKLNVYGNVQHFMETDTHTKFKAGVKFGF